MKRVVLTIFFVILAAILALVPSQTVAAAGPYSSDCALEVTPANPTTIDAISVDAFNETDSTMTLKVNQTGLFSSPSQAIKDIPKHTLLTVDIGVYPKGNYDIYMIKPLSLLDSCKMSISVSDAPGIATGSGNIVDVCNFIPHGPADDLTNYNNCKACLTPKPGVMYASMYTAIGCIPTDPKEFIAFLLTAATGIAGGIAFILIIFGGFTILTSAGNPEKLNAGKELVGSAIAGLLLIIFSLFILQLIGYNILGIPGFG